MGNLLETSQGKLNYQPPIHDASVVRGKMNNHQSFDYIYRRSRDRQWRREQNQQRILRLQWGFEHHEHMAPRFTQPAACSGCANYFGRTYGYSQNTRSILVCAMYPDGWHESPDCPDWRPCLSEKEE